MVLKSRFYRFVVLPLLLALAGGVWYWQTTHVSKTQNNEVIVKVFQSTEVIQPKVQVLSGRIDMSGLVVASEVAVLRGKSSGTLLRLNVQEGEAFKKGQVLAEIDSRDLIARSEEKEAALKSSQRANQLALSQHKANQELAKQGFISETALVNSEANLSNAWAQLKSAESAMTSHLKLVEDSILRAPFDGVLVRKLVSAGDKISVEQEVLSVMNPAQLEFKTMVDTSAAQFLQMGQSLRVQLEGHAQAVAGVIQRIGPGNESGARALPVFIKLAIPSQPPHVIRAGLMGTAQVSYSLQQNGLTLPITAVQEEGGKSIVWTIQDGLLKRQTVTLGLKDSLGLHVSILDGVKPTDHVLALRFEGLKEGAKAEVKP